MKVSENSCRLLIILLMLPFPISAQYTPTPLNDLAYVIHQAVDEEAVQQALYHFEETTGIPFRITTLFEEDSYTKNTLQAHRQWLVKHHSAISLLVWLDHQTQAYRSCRLEVSDALVTKLSISERKQIVASLMEPVFRSTPLVNDACTSGLLAGIQAIQKALQQQDYSIEAMVKETLLLQQKENKAALDSLRENLASQRKAYYKTIDDNGWLPWMYAGKDGVFVREGISQDEKINKQAQPFLGLTMQPEDRKKYSEAKLQLFDQWAAIYRTDKLLLYIFAKDSLVHDLLGDMQLRVFADQMQGQVQEANSEPPAAKQKLIDTLVLQHIEKELSDETGNRKK